LLKMEKLVAVAELGVKEQRGGDTEGGEQERCRARLIADQDQEPASELERDGKRKQLLGHPEHTHIGAGGRIGGELAPCLVQKQRREHEAAESGRPIDKVHGFSWPWRSHC